MFFLLLSRRWWDSEQCRSHLILTCLKHITRLRHFPITQHTEHSAGGGYAHV
nr:MAG TPA: hypothetical protein [Caudoviricetes sp.]